LPQACLIADRLCHFQRSREKKPPRIRHDFRHWDGMALRFVTAFASYISMLNKVDSASVCVCDLIITYRFPQEKFAYQDVFSEKLEQNLVEVASFDIRHRTSGGEASGTAQ
jgi:hypothetical protein